MTGAPTSVAFTRDGLHITALDWGGQGEPLVLLHPNGFCAGVFDPPARRLAASGRFRPVGIDLRGHGGTDPPATGDGFAFVEMAADVLAVLGGLGIERCVMLGESLGGGVAVLVDELRPHLITRLMLCEAIAFDAHPTPERPIERATMTRQRTDVWPDRETMATVYSQRPPLSEMAPEALAAYLQYGTVDLPDGQVRLACAPESEAAIYELSAHGGPTRSWEHLDSLTCEVMVLAGTTSFLPADVFHAQAARAGVSLELVDGGHFFLQADTDRAVELIEQHLN